MTPEEQLGCYKALLDTARRFGRTMDLNSLIGEILNRSQAVMRAEACSIFLPDDATGELILHSTENRLAGLPAPPRIPKGAGIAGAVFLSRQPINLRDARLDPRHYQTIERQVGLVTRAMLTVPLLNGAECLGVMQALNPTDRDCFGAVDEEILEGFAGLIVNALLRIEAQEQEIQQARSRQELVLAREIQESFLPPLLQSFPACQVRFRYFPANAVSGDFYFAHLLPNERLLMGVGDVSGKGIPAALTMARATAMIKAMIAQVGEDLGEWMTALGEQFAQDLRGGRFIGLTLLLANAASGTLQICSAGQFPPLFRHQQGWARFPMAPQLPLGVLSKSTYRAQSAPLYAGDQWLLFSDGIPEARNRAGEDFTFERFLASLPVGLNGAGVLEAGIQSWHDFTGNAPQHDDASLLLLDWRGGPPPAELDTTCCPENMALGRDFIEKWAAYAGFDDVTAGQIVMACDEAAANVFRHGYRTSPGPLRYEAGVEQNRLVIRIMDQAPPVEASQIKGRDLADLRPGGLGSVIISRVFDQVRYQPQAVGTVLVLEKILI